MEEEVSLERVAAEVVAGARELAGAKGVLLVGSAATVTTAPNSDYDFLVMIDDDAAWPMPFRDGGRRAWIDEGGRQVEVAYNTIARLRRRSAEEEATGSCLRRDGLAHARILWVADDDMRALVAESQAVVAAGPVPMERQDVLWECYDLWNQLKDIEDRLMDRRVVQILAGPTFTQFIRFFFRLERCWQPRPRDMLTAVAAVDGGYHALCIEFLDAGSARAQYDALERMASHLSARHRLKFEAGYTSSR